MSFIIEDLSRDRMREVQQDTERARAADRLRRQRRLIRSRTKR